MVVLVALMNTALQTWSPRLAFTPKGFKLITTVWLSVPPVPISKPRLWHSAARRRALLTTLCAYTFHSGDSTYGEVTTGDTLCTTSQTSYIYTPKHTTHRLQLHCERRNVVVVRAALHRREHRRVDLVADRRRHLLVVEDEPSARTLQGLVRRRRHHVAVLKGRRVDAAGNQPQDVGDVRHQVRAHAVGDLAAALVVPVPAVARRADDDQARAVGLGQHLDVVVVQQAGLLVHVVQQRREQDGRGGDLPLAHVEAVRQVPARGQAQTHDLVVRLEQAHVHLHVGRRPGERLHVDAPLLLAEVEGLQRALHAQRLHLVNHLAAAVVPAAGVPLGVLVGEHGTEGLHGSNAREVLQQQ
ncbi:uncharacterized protein BcabD6B2_54650 [Babesia caballi]|uniref:Secreted protein n=1 Tax=Babesia caballi TaxID=5871 RepID=A0AAV4M5C6_BABCB|nr:hypothetical protein BcabD6B2_54650 [Babesia caballi]